MPEESSEEIQKMQFEISPEYCRKKMYLIWNGKLQQNRMHLNLLFTSQKLPADYGREEEASWDSDPSKLREKKFEQVLELRIPIWNQLKIGKLRRELR